MTHKIVLKKTEVVEIETDDIAGMVNAATRLGFTVDEIDDQEVIAFCEACQTPIMVDNEYVCDPDDGICLCNACATELCRAM